MYKPFTVDAETKVLIENKLKAVAPDLTKKGVKWMQLFGCEICVCVQPNAQKYIPIYELIDVLLHKFALHDKNPSSMTWAQQLEIINGYENEIFRLWLEKEEGPYMKFKLKYLISN
ncbi:MAG TPA: hypothetical protein PLG30_14140 [Bacteroidia bacterium]|nr:hypothetical protein [Bacteroidia bacterium]